MQWAYCIDKAFSWSLMQTRRSFPIYLAKKWFDSIFIEFILFENYLTLLSLGFQLKQQLLRTQHKDNANSSAMHLLLFGNRLRRKIC